MRRPRLALVALLGALTLVGGCVSHAAATARSARATKLLIVVLENHAATDATAGLPGLAALAKRYGVATRSYAVAHPSLPNYLAMAGGSTFATKWLYHSVAKAEWNRDRIVWRFVAPITLVFSRS